MSTESEGEKIMWRHTDKDDRLTSPSCVVAVYIDNCLDEAVAAERAKWTARPRSEYHEDDGVVAWWDSDVCESHEPPYIGTPNDIDKDGMFCLLDEYQWWSRLPDFTPMLESARKSQEAGQ